MSSTTDGASTAADRSQSGRADLADTDHTATEFVEAIIDAIAQLPPSQRRKLQRRLQANGLFVPDILLTDQQRLTAAPALGDRFLHNRDGGKEQTAGRGNEASPPSFVKPAASPAPAPPEAKQSQAASPTQPSQKQSSQRRDAASTPTRATGAKATDSYHSPISGKIVVGSPTRTTDDTPDPHAMTPLPGQAPERPLILMIERGGYLLRWPGEAAQRVRLTFKAHVTEQEAFYDTLIGVLETVVQRLRESKADPQTARLDIRSADRLFVQQLLGEIPCEDIMLQIRCKHALKLLDHFHSWRLVHQE